MFTRVNTLAVQQCAKGGTFHCRIGRRERGKPFEFYREDCVADENILVTGSNLSDVGARNAVRKIVAPITGVEVYHPPSVAVCRVRMYTIDLPLLNGDAHLYRALTWDVGVSVSVNPPKEDSKWA